MWLASLRRQFWLLSSLEILVNPVRTPPEATLHLPADRDELNSGQDYSKMARHERRCSW